MSISEKLTQIAENEQKVYETGKDSSLRDMWEAIQCGGTRTNYGYLLQYMYWTPDTFKPIYDITQSTQWYDFGYVASFFTGYIAYLNEKGQGQISIKELEEEQGISFILGRGNGNHTRLCVYPLFSEYNIVDISQSTTTQFAFAGTYMQGNPLLPKRIEHLICSETTPFTTSTFQYASGYEYIGFEGVIAQNGLNLQWSTKLNKDSITALINALSDATSGLTVTISKTAKENAFTEEEWTTLIETKPNWTITLA